MTLKDKERMQALLAINAVLQFVAKDKGVDFLSDEECIEVLLKLSKQRQASINAYAEVWLLLLRRCTWACLVVFPHAQ